MSAVDPYVYEGGGDVLRNLFDERDRDALAMREQAVSADALLAMHRDPVRGKFGPEHLSEIHRRIFADVYPFAGKNRTISLDKAEIALGGRSVSYAPPDEVSPRLAETTGAMSRFRWDDARPKASARAFAKAVADVWQVHPFREGNTRTVMTFATDFAKARGFDLDRDAFARYPSETRDALAVATTGDVDGLARLIGEARAAHVQRQHPVVGRLTSEAAEVMDLMGTRKVRTTTAGDAVRGQVLTTSYRAVLIATDKGMVAVDVANFATPPANNARVNLTVEKALFEGAEATRAVAPGEAAPVQRRVAVVRGPASTVARER